MTRPSSDRVAAVLRVLFVFSPILIPAAIVLLFLLMFLVLIVVSAFMDGFAQGCAALAALIGIPSVVLLWLRAVGRVLNIPRRAPVVPASRRLQTDVAARYAAGDFVHRDDEEERQEWERHHHGP